MTNQTTLIIGANSEIAKALAIKIIADNSSNLIVISRDISFYQQSTFDSATVIPIKSYEELAISNTLASIKKLPTLLISQVFICHGILHNERCQPEKRLEDFSSESFSEIITANTLTPMLWLKHLTPMLSGKNPCKIVVFTARVGSISDNKLGGWYSYRASKAAMNMLVKSAAIELARRAKNIKLISFHPGTTDSPLSKPFQANVPEGKLFQPSFVAEQLFTITANALIDGDASYVDWQGKAISW